MNVKLLNENEPKTYAVVFDTGEEVVAGLQRFAEEHRLTASEFSAIGAFESLVLGYFDWQRKDYDRIAIDEQVEVLALLGNITLKDHDASAERNLHAHVVVGKRDGTAHGGHLLEAHVRPTLEVVVTESPRHLVRRPDEETGLALISLESAANAHPSHHTF